jgi:hypothetical protein
MPYTLKFLPSVLVILATLSFLVLLSLVSVSNQDQQIQESSPGPSVPQKDQKVYILEKGFEVELKLDETFHPWKDEEPVFAGVSSQLLFLEASITDNLTECIPIGFGYTKEESDKLFDPLASYPDCSLETPSSIKIEGSKLMKTCENMHYSLGKPPNEEMFGRVSYDLKWTPMTTDFIETGNREYVFIKCGEKREAAVFLKRNEKAAQRAKQLTEDHRKALGVQGKHRPLTVFMMVFDSVSRRHMYRSFPRTMEFLNASLSYGEYSNHFSAYDFLINHAHGENTIPNMVPYLFGYSFKYHKQRLGNRTHLNPEDSEFFLNIQKDSIWKQFEKMGFMTMFGFDIIWDFLVPAVGRVIKTDHVFTNFWKGASKVFGTDNYINEQCCFGSHDSHHYMLQYASSYLKEYEGINRFGYVHITTAHEKSGTIIKTVDDDLLDFMKDLLHFYNSRNEDLVFIMAGDHGKHVSETDFVKPGWLENFLPGQIVITNKDLMRRLGSDSVFRINTQRLVTRPDWHLTLKHLSLAPYGKLSAKSGIYNHWKTLTDSDFAVSLLLQQVSSLRTCQDMDIEEYFCVCAPYEEIPAEDVNSDPYIKHLVNYGFESTINSPKHELCRKLSFKQITYAAVRDLAEGLKIYRLRLTVNENPDVVIEMYASVFLGMYESKFRKIDYGGMSVKNLPGNLKQAEKMQLLKIVRIDEYAGFMEEFSVALQQKPTFCVPFMPGELGVKHLENQEMTDTIEKITQDIVVRVAEEGNSCFEECRKFEQICQPWAVQLLSNPEVFKKSWTRMENVRVLKGRNQESIDFKKFQENYSDFLGMKNDTIYYSSSKPTCHTKISSGLLFCPCKA